MPFTPVKISPPVAGATRASLRKFTASRAAMIMAGSGRQIGREVMRDPSVLAADIREYLEAENSYQGRGRGGYETGAWKNYSLK